MYQTHTPHNHAQIQIPMSTMQSHHPEPQHEETLRIRFYRAYIEGDPNHPAIAAPIKQWLEQAQNLLFDEAPYKYHETGNGHRVYTTLEQTSPQILFQINRTQIQGIPPTELKGDIRTDYLSPGQGLSTTWYAAAYVNLPTGLPSTVLAIATKGTRAPNNVLKAYIQNKFPDESKHLNINQLAHENLLETISNMTQGTLLEIGIWPSRIQTIRAADANMADAFEASHNLFPQTEITQTIKPSIQHRSRFINKFVPFVRKLLSDPEHRTAVTKLRFGGFYAGSSKTTIINLLSNDLTVDVQIPTNDPTFITFDPETVYAELQKAYDVMKDAIQNATEVAEWQAHTDGTKNTSLVPTLSQPSLFPQFS